MGKRASGSARTAIRAVFVHPQWAEADVARLGLTTMGGEAAPRGSTNPSCGSRPAEPGASYYVVSTRIDSSIAVFRFEASCSLLAVERARWCSKERVRTTRPFASFMTEMDAASLPSKTKVWVRRRPSHGGSSGRDQVRECVSWTAVPRSCVGVLTGQGWV